MSKDTIYRQAAIDVVSEHCGICIQRIVDLPSAQPERIRGRWVKDEEASNLHVEPIYICSACNNMDAWGETEKNTFKFCPNCGADMQEGGENATD